MKNLKKQITINGKKVPDDGIIVIDDPIKYIPRKEYENFNPKEFSIKETDKPFISIRSKLFDE